MLQKDDLVHQSVQSLSNSRKITGRLTIILISVLLLTMVGIGGYMLGANQQQPSPSDPLTKPDPSWSPSATPIQQLSPTPTIAAVQTDPTAGWKLYENAKYGFTIKYPLRARVEELSHGAASTFTNTFTIKFFSPEAAPDALIPEDPAAFKQFINQHLLVILQAYDNPNNYPLERLLREIYTQQSIVPQKTRFDLLKPRLQPYKTGLLNGLMFSGNLGENPQKSVFLAHNNEFFIITLYGGPDTGSNFSAYAEKTFDLMVSSLQ